MNVNVIPYSAFTVSRRELAIKLSPDGFAAFESGKWRICVNDDENIAFGRRNFTILHELGHIVLKHTEESDLADAEANFFAKFAQCPPILIYQYGLTSVGDIMEHFGVTLSVPWHITISGSAIADNFIQIMRFVHVSCLVLLCNLCSERGNAC